MLLSSCASGPRHGEEIAVSEVRTLTADRGSVAVRVYTRSEAFVKSSGWVSKQTYAYCQLKRADFTHNKKIAFSILFDEHLGRAESIMKKTRWFRESDIGKWERCLDLGTSVYTTDAVIPGNIRVNFQ
jgi:hypothetical protein